MAESTEEKTIGEIIAEARKNAGLSLRELAQKIEIHFTYLADIEKSNRKPSEKVLRSLSDQSELYLEFDYLMALAGRLGSETEKYLKEHPKFGGVVRQIVKENLEDSQLISFSEELPELIKKIKK